jgi:hypothetical protein
VDTFINLTNKLKAFAAVPNPPSGLSDLVFYYAELADGPGKIPGTTV